MPLTFALGISLAGVQPVPASGGGGGGEVTPLVSSDFKNGTYSVGGVSKTLGEVWEEDAAWSAYDPSSVIPGSGLSNAGFPVMVRSVSGPILASGFVAVVTINLVDVNSGSGATLEIYQLPEYTGNVGVTLDSIAAVPDWYLFNDIAFTNSTAPAEATPGVIKFAWRYSPVEGSAASCAGHPVITVGPLTDGGIPNSVLPEPGTGNFIEKIEFFSLTDYDASDLPTLSAL